MTTTNGIRVTIEDGVGTLTLARPEKLNAFDDVMIDALEAGATRLAHDDAVRVILLAAEGRGFCAGLDLKHATAAIASGAALPELVRRIVTRLHGTISELKRAPKPVVTALNGVAAGAGVGIALAGDLVVASSAASLALTYTKIGLAPDGGTTYFVTRLVGEKRAMDLFLSAEPLGADEAARLGLVSRVVPAERFEEGVRAEVLRLAAGPTRAFALAKTLVRDAVREGLETQMEDERRAIASTFASADFREGVQAFFEKRPPRFAGR